MYPAKEAGACPVVGAPPHPNYGKKKKKVSSSTIYRWIGVDCQYERRNVMMTVMIMVIVT